MKALPGLASAADDEAAEAPQKQVRTFVVVKRDEHWLIMQDHNTTVASPPT